MKRTLSELSSIGPVSHVHCLLEKWLAGGADEKVKIMARIDNVDIYSVRTFDGDESRRAGFFSSRKFAESFAKTLDVPYKQKAFVEKAPYPRVFTEKGVRDILSELDRKVACVCIAMWGPSGLVKKKYALDYPIEQVESVCMSIMNETGIEYLLRYEDRHHSHEYMDSLEMLRATLNVDCQYVAGEANKHK